LNTVHTAFRLEGLIVENLMAFDIELLSI